MRMMIIHFIRIIITIIIMTIAAPEKNTTDP